MRAERSLFFWLGIFMRDGVISEEAVRIISKLDPGLEFSLLVDISRADFERTPGIKEFVGRFRQVLYLADYSDTGSPELFDLIKDKSGFPSEQCLVLDNRLKRTVASINHRLPAAVIIDNEHLEREFLLRRLSEGEYLMHRRPV